MATKFGQKFKSEVTNAYPRRSTIIFYLIQILRFFSFFPPSYVVTKLTYSDRNFYEPIFLVDDVVKTKKISIFK